MAERRRNKEQKRASSIASYEQTVLAEKRTSTWISFGVIAFIGLAVSAFFLQIYTSLYSTKVQHLQVTDEVLLKRVFFSGEPWMVYCFNDPSDKISAELQNFADMMHPRLQTGILDCTAPLPSSSKSTFERFGLTTGRSGDALFISNAHAPKLLGKSQLESVKQVELFLKDKLEPEIVSVASTVALENACKSKRKDGCVVILEDGAADEENSNTLIAAASQLRRWTFARINAQKFQFSLESKLPPTTSGQEYPRVIALRWLQDSKPTDANKEASPDASDDKDSSTSQSSIPSRALYAKVHRDAFDVSSVSAFLKGLTNDATTSSASSSTSTGVSMARLPKMPSVIRRKKRKAPSKKKATATNEKEKEEEGKANKKSSSASTATSRRKEREAKAEAARMEAEKQRAAEEWSARVDQEEDEMFVPEYNEEGEEEAYDDDEVIDLD